MKKNDKPLLYKRIIAYLVDMLVISVIASLITMAFPKNDAYQVKLKEASEITKQYQNKEIEEEEFRKRYNDVSYEMSKSTIDQSIIVVIVTISYFTLLYKFNNGQTLGKRLMKLRVVSANDKEIGINHYLLRCLLINSALSNIITIILLMFLSKDKYVLINDKLSLLFSIFYVACVGLIMYRDDGRGIHDFITNTKVIDTRKEEKVENKQEIKEKINSKKTVKEAEIVKEKEEDNHERTIRTRNSKKK